MENSLHHTDSGIGDEQVVNVINGSDLDHRRVGPGAVSKLISTLSLEVRKSQENLSEPTTVEILKPHSSILEIGPPNKNVNIKKILKSLVAAPMEGTETGLDSLLYSDAAAKAQPILPVQFHSFDR